MALECRLLEILLGALRVLNETYYGHSILASINIFLINCFFTLATLMANLADKMKSYFSHFPQYRSYMF